MKTPFDSDIAELEHKLSVLKNNKDKYEKDHSAVELRKKLTRISVIMGTFDIDMPAVFKNRAQWFDADYSKHANEINLYFDNLSVNVSEAVAFTNNSIERNQKNLEW